MSATAPTNPRPVRRRSGTAKWHMSRAAIDLSLDDVYRMDDKECMELLVHARFGG